MREIQRSSRERGNTVRRKTVKEMRGSDWIPIWLSPSDCFWIIWVGFLPDPQFHQHHFKSPTNQFWQNPTQFHINLNPAHMKQYFYLCFSFSFIFLSPFLLSPTSNSKFVWLEGWKGENIKNVERIEKWKYEKCLNFPFCREMIGKHNKF